LLDDDYCIGFRIALTSRKRKLCEIMCKWLAPEPRGISMLNEFPKEMVSPKLSIYEG
jgi:hypothetical protein